MNDISSVVGFLPAPFMRIYSATKHALESFGVDGFVNPLTTPTRSSHSIR
jgi:hypothetical protein